MTAKNGEYCKFETLEKRETKAKMGDFWGQKTASFAGKLSLN